MSNLLRNSLAAYSDVRRVFDAAVERGELVVELPSPGKAINFKQRANKFRNLERARIAEQGFGVPGFRAETAYDIFEITFFPPLNEKKVSNRVWFRPREIGRLIDPNTGKEIK